MRKALHCTRSAYGELLLERGTTRLATAGDRAFVDVSPFLMNRIPYSVRGYNTFEMLKSHSETHLFIE